MASVRWAINYSLWKPTRDEWLFASRCIQREETERILNFCFGRDAKASMCGRLMMRKFLSDALGLPYAQIRLGRSEKGKPYLAKPVSEYLPVNDFNVSHQGSFTVLAADKCPKVGVDVMKIEYTGGKPLSDFFKLMQRQFSPAEWNFICMPSTEKDQLARFIRLWCLKESFVKAEGVGIGFNLQRISFHCHTMTLRTDSVVTDTHLFVDEEPLDTWTFEESLINGDHCVAVALQRDIEENSNESNVTDKSPPKLFHHLEFTDLVSNAFPLYESESQIYWEVFAKKPELPT